jgi:hypothetical protein
MLTRPTLIGNIEKMMAALDIRLASRHGPLAFELRESE